MEKKTPVWRVTSKGDAHFKKIRAVPSTQAERLADLAAAVLIHYFDASALVKRYVEG